MPFTPGNHSFFFRPVPKISDLIGASIQHKLDFKTKPKGSLGRLEEIALHIGSIQNTLEPKLEKPTLFIFAADHGIAQEGVSAYPQEVTYQMVLNFLHGGAAANVLARQGNIDLEIIDAGVNFDFGVPEGLINQKVGKGTKNFSKEPAMTELELLECLKRGKELAKNNYAEGTNLLAFGEMGIANTSSSSLLTHLLTGTPLENCVGSGTGLSPKGIQNKVFVLQKSLDRFHQDFPSPGLMDVFRNFGGFEILMMAGAMLEAGSLGMTLVVDGFISSSAFLCAYYIEPGILDYTLFSHLSEERGHIFQLSYLKKRPLLELGLRLGEGTGALLSIPLIRSSLAILNEMASFDSAGVSQKEGK